MNNEIDNKELVKEMKQVTRSIYSQLISKKGLLKINQKNYLKIFNKYTELSERITKLIDLYKPDKSLFLDFFNFQLQVNYCFEMIIQKQMTTKEIFIFMGKEKDYLDYTFQSIIDIDISEL